MSQNVTKCKLDQNFSYDRIRKQKIEALTNYYGQDVFIVSPINQSQVVSLSV